VGDADARIAEDYLRILRLFRFLAELEGFSIDCEAAEAASRGRRGLRRLSAERVRAELVRLLVAPRALDATSAILDRGLLTDVLGQVPRPVVLMRMASIEQAAGRNPDAMLRLAALAVRTDEDAARLARRLALSNRERRSLANAAAAHGARPPAIRHAKRQLYRLGPAAYSGRMLMGWALSREGRDDARWREAAALGEDWSAPQFPVNGKDLMEAGLAAGPRMGSVLRRLEETWLASDFSMDREALLREARSIRD
jgi:poly(A) polymerase